MLPAERQFLRTPHGLHNIAGLAQAPDPGDRWRVIREWLVAGPFPLDRNAENPRGYLPVSIALRGPKWWMTPWPGSKPSDGADGWKYSAAT